MFLCLVTWSSTALARKPQDFFGYIGAGNNFVIPGSIRLGWDDWEVGQIEATSYGIGKRFFFKESAYSEFGLSATGIIKYYYPGFFASMGFDTHLFWIVGLRGEIIGVVAYNGYLTCKATLGLSLDF
jgi:hypothetical protein